MDRRRITVESRGGRPLCGCYDLSADFRTMFALRECPRCRGTGGDFTRATGSIASAVAADPATLRPTATRPTVPAPAAEVCQGALTTLAAVATGAGTRALDAERNVLACNALAERLSRVAAKVGDPGVADHWQWLASEAHAAAQALARAATAERAAADAARRLRALVADAEGALALIAQGSSPAPERPTVPRGGAAPTVLPPAIAEGE